MIATIITASLLKGALGMPPAIWPLERQDRFGTAQAIEGLPLSEYAAPWRHIEFGNFITSHGPSFDGNGNGYFGRWVDYTVRRFNPETGQITGTLPMSFHVDCTPAIGDGRIFVKQQTFNSQQGFVAGVNVSNLSIDWLNVSGYIVGSPTIGPEGDIVYAQENATVRRVSGSTGGDVWATANIHNPVGTVHFLRDDSAVVIANGNKVTALNWANGSVVWSYDSGFKTGRVAVAPDGTVVFGNEGNRVIGLNPDGTLKWTRFTSNRVEATPAFGLNGEVYIGSHDWAMYAFRTSDGGFLWNYLTNHWISQPATVDVNGLIYVQNRLGHIYCLRPDGTLAWTKKVGDDARGPMTFGPKGTLYVGYQGNPSGMVSIRQDAPRLNFELSSLSSGFTSTGTGESLKTVDGDFFSVLSESSGTISSLLDAEFEAFVPKRQLDAINLSTTLKLNSLAAVKFDAFVFNYTSNSWQPVPILVRLSTSLNTFVLNFGSPPTQAVEAGSNRVKVRLRMERFTRPTSQWGIDIEKLSGSVNPTF